MNRKLYLAVAAVVLMMLSYLVFVTLSLRDSRAAQTEVKEFPELQAVLGTRTIDHFHWTGQLVQETFIDQVAFTGTTDPRKCKLGEWYYGYTPPELLAAEFRAIEEPHRRIHESGAKIRDAMLEKNAELARRLYQETTRPALAAVQERMTAMRLAVKKLVDVAMQRAMDNSERQAWVGMAIFLGVTLAFCVIGIPMARRIIRGINACVAFAADLAKGNLTRTLEGKFHDEVATLAKALNTMGADLRAMFKDTTSGVQTLAAASTELAAISEQMANGAQRTSSQAGGIASTASEMSSTLSGVAELAAQASSNVQSVAAATEEMTSTVTEIARSAEKARSVTAGAVEQAAMVTTRVNELGGAARDIGKITEAISAISAQTNLLALNATIEAVRAGAAGKGFAVVASEIKALAQQTATATEDIKGKIEGIQGTTTAAVENMGRISTVIKSVNEIVTTIAAAIEEQSMAAREIAANVSHAAQGIAKTHLGVDQSARDALGMTQGIGAVNAAIVEISSSAAQVRMSADELSLLSEQLKTMVGRFTV